MQGETLWQVVFLIVIFLVSFIGNILVIMVVYRSRRNQWTTNHFVLNLAMVNLVVPTLCLLLTVDLSFCSQWLFGSVGCRVIAFLVHFNALASIGILFCMSLDRFYLTAYPLTFKLSKTQTKKVILAIWLLAVSISCPMAYFYEMNTINFCLPELSMEWRTYFSCFTILFFLPHFTTYAIYLKVYRCIRARNRNLTGARFVQKVPKTKVKVTRLLAIQVGVYTLLWLPYIIYELVESFSVNNVRSADLAVRYIAYISSAASPVIYTLFSGDFRRGCKLMFMKYDASIAYRLPEFRKNRVNVLNSNFGLSTILREEKHDENGTRAEKRESVESRNTEPATGMAFFGPSKVAWSNA